MKLIRANHSYAIPKETVTHSKASPSTTEWGLNAINAPQVWSTFNDRGEGIVISSIDTGVRGSHAALVGHYRGNTAAAASTTTTTGGIRSTSARPATRAT